MIRIYDKNSFQLIAEVKNLFSASKELGVSAPNLCQNKLFDGVHYTRSHWIINHSKPECRAFIKAMIMAMFLENPDKRGKATQVIDDAYEKLKSSTI